MNGSSAPDQGVSPGDESMQAIESVARKLYDVMREDVPFEDKARTALEIGRVYLGADNGHLTQIDQETDHWEALISTDPPEGNFPEGLEVNLTTTYCRRVLETSSQIALNDAETQGWADDPAYETHQLHCYVGTPIRVNGAQYGTVCFVGEAPRESPFTDSEKLLAELISHMLERELEREQFEAQITRQTNLSLVLNRVLRHNLRNEVAVIRGYTQLMAEKLSDSNFCQVALSSIDRLLNIGEKARELDEIIASDEKRDRENIRAIVEQEVTDLRRTNQSASISIDGDEDVTAVVFPSFGRAMWELVENAVKHGGPKPTVNITIESVPNAVEIRIADDGPGLDNQELEVLRSGSETPLMHGSGLGLWLTYWIVSRHDGTIEASVTDEGSTLIVTVPRTPLTKGSEQVSELVRARDQYKAAFDEAGDGMTITDDQARILDVNDEAARLYGIDRQEILGRSMREFLPAAFDFESEWGEIKAEASTRGELQIARADGGVSTIEYTANANVVPGQHLIVSRDVTERKERERKLERTREFFEQTQRLGNIGAWEIDGAGTLRWTSGTRRIHEVDDDFEPTVAEAIEFYHPDDRDEIEDALQAVRATGEPFDIEARIITATGDLRWVRACGGATDSGEAVRGYVQDISEQKEQEDSLQETKQRLEAIIELSPEPVLTLDSSGTVTVWNEAAEDVFGYTAEEVVGEGVHTLDLFDEEYSAQFNEYFERVVGGETIRGLEVQRQRKDGTSVDLSISAIPFSDSSDDETGVLAVAQDITGLKERERDLERTNEFLATLFETIPAGVAVLDTDGNITRANSYAEAELGLVESEITDRTYQDPEWEIYGKDDEPIPADELPFSRVLETGEMVEDYEHGITLPDGSNRWLSINAAPITTESGVVEKVIAVITNVTDLRDQRQTLEAKNARLEEFAGTLSHDLRNPLSVSQGHLDLAREECDSEHLVAVDRALVRMGALIADLLTLARAGVEVTDRSEVALQGLAESSWKTVDVREGSLIVETEQTVLANENRLRQLLENLFRNAIDHGSDDVTVRVGELADGFYVEDDGPGIPEHKREAVFEPGYSERHEGAGFGLSIVKRVVEAHGWEIRITDGSDGGARFEITGVEFVAE